MAKTFRFRGFDGLSCPKCRMAGGIFVEVAEANYPSCLECGEIFSLRQAKRFGPGWRRLVKWLKLAPRIEE